MNELKTIKDDFNNIIKYTRYGKLDGITTTTDNLISLLKVESDINKLRKIRESLLKKFEYDVDSVISKDQRNNYVRFNPRRLMQGDLLDLDIYLNGKKYEGLFSNGEVKSINIYDLKIEEAISKIMPYIKQLFHVYEDEKMQNILSNDFYIGMDVYIGQRIEKLLINGDGVIITDSCLENLNLTIDEKLELVEYFYKNLDKILKRINIADDTSLDKFKPMVSEGKVLTYYRGRK